jgi:peptide subunit release factor 1 (eRF1)
MKLHKRVTVPCPDCEWEIDLGPTPEEGQRFTCPNCWAYLKIISLEPLELNWDVEEDWADDWEVEKGQAITK